LTGNARKCIIKVFQARKSWEVCGRSFREKVSLFSDKIIIKQYTNMTDANKDQEFVDYVVRQLVNNPDDVKVERKIDEMGVLITLDVNPQDMGMIIGREGATAKALRTLLRVIGAKNNARVNLKINEPAGSERGRRDENEKKSIDEVVGDINV